MLAFASTLQTPLVQAHLIASEAPMTASERARFLVPEVLRLRARYLRSERARWQRRYLSALDEAGRLASLGSIGRGAIRSALARSKLPDPVALLALPDPGPPDRPGLDLSGLLPLLEPEPEPRPPWIGAEERWPPGRREVPASRVEP